MDTVSISPLAAHAAGDLRMVVGRLIRRLRQSDADDEITMAQVSVLKRLDREGVMTCGALAQADRVRPQSMSTILSALEAQGLVARRADPDDRRRVVMSLTSAGELALQGVRRLREEQLGRAIEDNLTVEEQQTLIDALQLIERLVDAL